jgi:hypothetical protein
MIANLEKELASTCIMSFDAKPAFKTAWTKKLWIYDFRTKIKGSGSLYHT